MEDRQRLILEVLEEATEPIGPTEMARRINEEWCLPGGYPYTAVVCRELKRIPNIRKCGKGRYELIREER